MPSSDACVVYEGSSDPRATGFTRLLDASGPRTTGPGGPNATLSDIVLYSIMHFIVYDMILLIAMMLGAWRVERKYLNKLAL